MRGPFPFVRFDFPNLDLVVALDAFTARVLQLLAPVAERHKVRLLTEWDAASSTPNVRNPWRGSPVLYDAVFVVIERACRGLVAKLAATRRPAPASRDD